MASGGGEGHHAGDADPDVQALRASFAALQQRFDALSLDVQRILAANWKLQDKEADISDAEQRPRQKDARRAARGSLR